MLAAKQHHVTLNDLMVRDWFLATGDFRTRNYPDDANGWLRLAVPMNLRGPNHEGIPAANVVSMVFLDRRPSELADREQLLGGIHREMEQIKRDRLGLAFVVSLYVARAVPWCLSLLTRADRCRATAVLTNLGTPLRQSSLPLRDGLAAVGDMVLDAVDILTPLRPHTHAAVGVLTYAGRLHIALRDDPGAIQPAQADDLVEAFMARCGCLGCPKGTCGAGPDAIGHGSVFFETRRRPNGADCIRETEVAARRWVERGFLRRRMPVERPIGIWLALPRMRPADAGNLHFRRLQRLDIRDGDLGVSLPGNQARRQAVGWVLQKERISDRFDCA